MDFTEYDHENMAFYEKQAAQYRQAPPSVLRDAILRRNAFARACLESSGCESIGEMMRCLAKLHPQQAHLLRTASKGRTHAN